MDTYHATNLAFEHVGHKVNEEIVQPAGASAKPEIEIVDMEVAGGGAQVGASISISADTHSDIEIDIDTSIERPAVTNGDEGDFVSIAPVTREPSAEGLSACSYISIASYHLEIAFVEAQHSGPENMQWAHLNGY